MNESKESSTKLENERIEMEKYILVILFLIQQRWGYIINKELAEDEITTKQWLLMIVLANAFENPPSMQKVADAMSTTHQNVKQLATRLEDRGFLKINRDPNNRRALRLNVTKDCMAYWEKRSPEDMQSIKSFFSSLKDQEVNELFKIMSKLEKISEKLYLESKQ
jgi:DNA-binding MarR family transcriptional regulator